MNIRFGSTPITQPATIIRNNDERPGPQDYALLFNTDAQGQTQYYGLPVTGPFKKEADGSYALSGTRIGRRGPEEYKNSFQVVG